MDVISPDPNLTERIVGRVIDALRRRRMAVTATYRVQLHRDFSFRDAAAIVPYLRDLGISHVYCAPYFRAQTGGRHGYDICDHTQFNPELGGADGFQEFTAAVEAFPG